MSHVKNPHQSAPGDVFLFQKLKKKKKPQNFTPPKKQCKFEQKRSGLFFFFLNYRH